MKIYGKISHLDGFSKWEKIICMGIFYGKLYYSCNRTFSLENGKNFIEGTDPHINKAI